ncbi:MAG: dehydrogenase [Candidatus Saganbacteria bacterium]|nr:dehydrogenase [Candidatus Saganbacteria bacterium]
MDLILNNITIPLEEDDPSAYRKIVVKKLNLADPHIQNIKVLKKSLDARNKKQFYYNISLIVTVPDKYKNKKRIPVINKKGNSKDQGKGRTGKSKNKIKDRPIIIGFGPAGIFAALTFLEHGIKPIIFERGKRVEDRMKDIQDFEKNKVLDPESNTQFGEGGAGTYSDGKLATRIKETGYVAKVIDTFIKFGASQEIAYLNKPHLGTDQLCKIIKNIREYIQKNGGEINFESKVADLIVENKKVKGVDINGYQKCYSSNIIFAIGHSARDTFKLLYEKGVTLEQKPFAVGVRIEHPAETINLMQYGDKYKNHPKLGPAEYILTHQGAFSFCMCPGGEIVNASSENGMMTLNGMSNSLRNSPFSNSAIVAKVETADLGSPHPLDGIEFQRMIEKKCFNNWKAPAQNLLDFLSSTKSLKINPNSFKMDTFSAELKNLFPDFIYNKIVAAFKYWEERFPLFICKKATLLAPESRTSSPVRIVRNEKRESVSYSGFYPVGEGSGYSGGITSSAVDAIKTVESILGAL